MTIKPGCLCILINAEKHPQHIGRVVTAVEVFFPGWWVIEAPWMPPNPTTGFWTAREQWLKPISDPDADLTEKDDAALDNLLDALQYTKEAA